MSLAMCEVPVHPVEFLSESDLSALPELPMTQDEDGTYFCNGESTQYTQEQGTNIIDCTKQVSSNFVAGEGTLTGSGWGVKVFDNDWVMKNLKPSMTYYGKMTVIMNEVMTDKTVASFAKRFILYRSSTSQAGLYSGVMFGYYQYSMSNGESININASFTTPDDLTDLVVLAYTERYTNEDGTGQYCSNVTFSDIMLSEVDTPYEPFTPAMPSPDYPSPILNTYPAGTYKAICGDKTYKVVMDDDLRSVPGVADRVRIDAGRGVCWLERKVGLVEYDGSTDEKWRSYAPYKGFYTVLESMNAGVRQSGYCNQLTNSNVNIFDMGFWHGVNNNILYVIQVDDYAGTVEDWRTWLSSNPLIFYYILADPTTHQSVPTQLTTISSGRSVTIEGTVNDAVDMLAVKGDSWQLVQEEITDEEGNVTQPAMPSPEYPSEIVSVEGEMRSCGWNIADIIAFSATSGNTLTNNYGTEISTTEPTNKLIVNQTPNNEYGPGAYQNGYIVIKLKNKMISKRKYIVSFDIDITSNPFNVGVIGLMINGTTSSNIKLQENGKCRGTIDWIGYLDKNFLEIRCMGMSFTISNIQITEETQERPYDRHRGNSITLPVLRGLPDGTRDVLYVDRAAKRAWVERNVGVAVLDGSEDENWKVDSNNGFRIAVSDMKNGKLLSGYCNRFRSNLGFSLQCIMFGYNSSILYFPETLDIADTLDDWKTWLSSNPVTVQYALATPTIEELEYSDYLLETCQYETNIRIDCDEHLEPEIGVVCKVLGR